ncbi:DUF6512 family protein [Haloplasma contractile]|uniref:Uncharacterized protein n=1 Tax=Haloplasma contractile SSD-17B TaxID=1033810 RepID=F7PWJ8_9MOLU|nr:DUF6512 family protein [Haloplasma contractile]ERJ12635.1 hypothetical protein HLPCO_001636 [Haloplasma contractile SSD-17B]
MKIKRWEFLGVFLVFGIGTLLHFTYEWSDQNSLVALFSPVNESVWEHLKLAFYGMLFYAVIEYLFAGHDHKNFLFAKAVSSIIAAALVVVLYYGYTEFIDQSLAMDIVIFAFAIILAQIISYLLIRINLFFEGINYIGIILIFIVVMAFSAYTFEPPVYKLFTESGINLFLK